MASPGRPQRNRTARSFHQLRRFHHVINSDKVFGTHGLISEIAAWQQQRNAAGARIKWMFTTKKARAKMGRAYPVTSKGS
jgi:hypothetical protein